MTSWPLTSREAWSSMISTWVTASVGNFSVDLVTGRPPQPDLFPHDDATWAPPGARARGVAGPACAGQGDGASPRWGAVVVGQASGSSALSGLLWLLGLATSSTADVSEAWCAAGAPGSYRKNTAPSGGTTMVALAGKP